MSGRVRVNGDGKDMVNILYICAWKYNIETCWNILRRWEGVKENDGRDEPNQDTV
jgi:hypothetical protein